VFGTKLSTFRAKPTEGRSAVSAFYYPKDGAPWKPQKAIESMIDNAYIQWPHIYMNQLFSSNEPSPIPPRVGYHHLRVPGDVVSLLNVAKVHREGTTGRGVKVAMIDSGFAHGHPYFQRMGYNTSVVLAPGATDSDLDGNGHGTGESANLLAIAPDVHFIGVKLDNETNPAAGASLLEGFQEAMSHSPDIVSVSLGFDLVPTNPMTGRRTSNNHLTNLPNSLVALEAEIEAAVAGGATVVFSAGNGHVAFPGMMPDVISAGGTFVDEDGSMIASDYASGFTSKIYAGRNVPDYCGLVGLAANHADYIMLPVQSGCEIDQGNSSHDGTSSTDGWGVFSGTSAAAPQIAGICALLKQKNPGLTPDEIKNVLRLTSIDVVQGQASAASNEGSATQAGPGPDNAAGSGLVDAFGAWRQV
jgi:subtilisin family serine protease